MPTGQVVGAGAKVRRGIIIIAVILWAAGFVVGARYLLTYEKTPGQVAGAPRQWPQGVPDTGETRLPTLVLALHPRCSCSRASIAELEKASQRFPSPFNAVMLIYQPGSASASQGDWQNNALYRTAQKDLHAQLVADTDGAMAAKFGAETSGEVILYSAQDKLSQRQLLYAGGVTGARGMEGGNAGVEALVQAFTKQLNQPGRPVYGCGLASFAAGFAPHIAAAKIAGSEVAQ